VVIFVVVTESGNGPVAWWRPGCLAGCAGVQPGVMFRSRDEIVPGGQAAVVPQTCTWAGAVRVVMPRGACENGCLDLILWSR
jgi:hypothetical protein